MVVFDVGLIVMPCHAAAVARLGEGDRETWGDCRRGITDHSAVLN